MTSFRLYDLDPQHETIGYLRDRAVEFDIGPDGGAQPVSQLSREIIFRNRRIVLCRAGHPLAAATSLRELVGQD